LGGVTRMTISLAVILLECTGDYQAALPLMVALMTARFVGNYFNHGLFDALIEVRKWPLLEEHAKKAVAAVLTLEDVMVPNPVVMREVGRRWVAGGGEVAGWECVAALRGYHSLRCRFGRVILVQYRLRVAPCTAPPPPHTHTHLCLASVCVSVHLVCLLSAAVPVARWSESAW
jgi:hypothetical protein